MSDNQFRDDPFGEQPYVNNPSVGDANVSESNPYASFPPMGDGTTTGPSGPTYTLFTVGGVGWGTFFGSFLGGALVMAVNYKRLGQSATAIQAVVWGVIATAIFMTLAFYMPEFPGENMLYLAVQLGVMLTLARKYQEPRLIEHYRAGGKPASNWGASGIGFLSGLLILGIMIVVLIFALPSFFGVVTGTHYDVNGSDEIYYSGDATRADAKKLDKILADEEYWDGEGYTVTLSKEDGVYIVSFILVDDAWNEEQVVWYYEMLGESLADEGFGRPLKVQFVDEWFDVKKTVMIE